MSATGQGPSGDGAPAATEDPRAATEGPQRGSEDPQVGSEDAQVGSEDARAAAEAREQARARAEAIAYGEQNRKDRAKARTLTNMVWALLACFVVVAFLMIVTWRPKEEKVRAVEYTAQLQDARKVAPWVRGPEPMPAGWSATSVEFRAPEQQPITWHLGVVTDAKKYVGLEQSNVTGGEFPADKLGRTTDDGTSTVGGVTWQRKILLDRKKENALVLVGSGVTTIVTGNAGYPALEAFASTLR
jgi:preprotein translocase subunit SecG